MTQNLSLSAAGQASNNTVAFVNPDAGLLITPEARSHQKPGCTNIWSHQTPTDPGQPCASRGPLDAGGPRHCGAHSLVVRGRDLVPQDREIGPKNSWAQAQRPLRS